MHQPKRPEHCSEKTTPSDYVYGKPVTIETDHQPLVSTKKTHTCNTSETAEDDVKTSEVQHHTHLQKWETNARG